MKRILTIWSPERIHRLHVLQMSGMLVLLLALSACADEKQAPEATPKDIHFSISPISTETFTRAYDDYWQSNDNVGIYMVKHYETPPQQINLTELSEGNHKYTTGNLSADSKTVDLLADGGKKLHFPSDGSNVNFIAYYPYSADMLTADQPHVYPVNVGGGTQTLNQIDLLYHTDATDAQYNYFKDEVPLTFKHQLSKLNISILPGTTGIDLTQTTIALTGFPTTASFDLATGELSNKATPATTSAPITPVRTDDTTNPGTATFEAILIPAAESEFASRQVEFSIGGIALSYLLPETGRDMETGKEYNYTFTLINETIVLSEVTIAAWEDGNDDPDIIEF